MIKVDAELRAEIEAAYESGLSPMLIARRLAGRCSYGDVDSVIINFRRNRRREAERNGGPRNRTLNIHVSEGVYERLEPHARRRGLSVSRLAGRLINVSPDMVDAILDDRNKRIPKVKIARAPDEDQGIAPVAYDEKQRLIACDGHLADLCASGLAAWPSVKIPSDRMAVLRRIVPPQAPVSSYAGSPSAMCADQTA